MAIYDCVQFFNEENILDLRLNILDEYVDFCVSDYGAFYELMFEGFDDCENSEEESGEEEPNTDDDEFIDDDIDEDTPYYEYGSDDELDEDENDYSDGSC